MKIWIKLLIGLFIIALFLSVSVGGLYIYYNSELNKEIAINNTNATFEIPKGSSVASIADKLVSLGFLSRPEILKVYLWQNPDKIIQAGYYHLNDKKISLVDLVDVLQTGSFDVKLTFLEGWRVEEYGDYLAKNISPEFAKDFLASPYIKEGYMFPDTYTIDRDYDPSALATFMRNTFDKKVPLNLFDLAAQKGLSKDEVVIIASILEREMNIEKDKPIVAGIFVKRLQNGWPLQADATVQYAKGVPGNWWPKSISSDVKTLDSPYNTYINKGLPPTPISNPGLSSIKAVVNYVETPYWFYITDNNGVTHFSKTLEEHNKNIRDYLR